MSEDLREPNLYQLQGHGLHITYSTSGIDGKPHFSYHDTAVTVAFTGDQIRTQQTEDGTLVVVTIRPTIDSGSTTFTLVVPSVNLDMDTSAPISTIGITTQHKFSIIPALRHGQAELYSVTRLHGTASEVEF